MIRFRLINPIPTNPISSIAHVDDSGRAKAFRPYRWRGCQNLRNIKLGSVLGQDTLIFINFTRTAAQLIDQSLNFFVM